jgi:cyclic beta-1,2-glucan synthetase
MQSPAAGTVKDSAILANATPGQAGYTVLIRADGTGYSSCSADGTDTALTHWTGQGGPAREGLQVFLRDRDTGAYWAFGAGLDPDAGVWSPGRYVITQTQDGIQATQEVWVVADAPAEVRRLTLTNLGSAARRLDVTSLAEVVQNDAGAHAAHPAFSKLFLQTEHIAAADALLVSRRPRDPHERHPVLVHALVHALVPALIALPPRDGTALPCGGVEWETDRARFFGRGRHQIGRASCRERV